MRMVLSKGASRLGEKKENIMTIESALDYLKKIREAKESTEGVLKKIKEVLEHQLGDKGKSEEASEKKPKETPTQLAMREYVSLSSKRADLSDEVRGFLKLFFDKEDVKIMMTAIKNSSDGPYK